MTEISDHKIPDAIRLMAKIGRCWSPSLSPDQRQIAFVSDITGIPQVWRMPISGGFPERVTSIEEQVNQVQWSPTSDWLAVESAMGGGMNSQIDIVRPDGTGLRRLTVGGLSNNWLNMWSKDGESILFSSNMDDANSMDSYQVAIDSAKIQSISKNGGTGRIDAISSDGQQVIVSRVAYRGDNNHYLVDTETNTETLLTPHDPPGSFYNALFDADDKQIYLISNRDSDLGTLVRFPVNNLDEWTVVCARDDAELVEFTLANDGDKIALVWNIAGRTELELFSLASNTSIAMIDLPCEIVSSLKFSKDDRLLLMCLNGSQSPMDIWTLDVATHALHQLTFSPHAGVNLDTLVKPTLETYTAHDDLTLTGWLYTPNHGKAPYPTVLSFHGGPEGQEQPRLRYEYQAILAQGIAVFAPNVRGSSGFGKRFVNLDNGALRVNAVKDIESTANHLTEQGIAKSGHLGIMGGSYGGYMTMAGLTEFPTLFAAGANLYGVVNFKTFFEQTEPWMAAISKIEYGDPDTEADMLYDLSPINKLDQVISPTLVLHGANDTNVPVIEAEQVVEQLKERDVPVAYVLFPDEGHGFKREENRLTSIKAIVGWFTQYLL